MSNVYLSATVNKDGSLTIPAFAVRGLGYKKGDEVSLAVPTENCACRCADSELLIARVCDERTGYTTDGDELSIPAALLQNAGIPLDNAFSVLSAEGVLVIAAAANGLQRDFTDEIGCFLEELGYDPDTVETVNPLPF
jgi:hypothetical protein